MPHIFFERLERRKSTQSLLPMGGGLNMGSSGMSQAYSSSYSQSNLLSNSFSIPSNYSYGGGISNGFFGGVTCYAYGPFGPGGPYGPIGPGSPYPLEYLQPYSKSMGLNQYEPFTSLSPSWTIPNTWTSPIQNNWQNLFNTFPSMNYQNTWTSPIQNNWQSPIHQSPFELPGSIMKSPVYDPWPEGMTCYAVGPPYLRNLGISPVSKLKKVRNNLLAFFQNKGILSDEQRQRLISSPFNKA